MATQLLMGNQTAYVTNGAMKELVSFLKKMECTTCIDIERE